MEQGPHYLISSDMQSVWDAFAVRYAKNHVENYTENVRANFMQRRAAGDSTEVPQFSKTELDALEQRARHSAQLLYELAFSSMLVTQVIAAHLPAKVKPQDRRHYIHTILHADLKSVTEAMATEAQEESWEDKKSRKQREVDSGKEAMRALRNMTLDRMAHVWVVLREQEARDVKIDNFQMPHAGTMTHEQRMENRRVHLFFNAFLERENAAFLSTGIEGLCSDYIGSHTRNMRKAFTSDISGEDIRGEEDKAFKRALRLYKTKQRSAEDRGYKAFISYLVDAQKEVSVNLAALKASGAGVDDALSHPYTNLGVEDKYGKPLSERWIRPGQLTPLADVIHRETNKTFNDLLMRLLYRERQILVLRLGLKIPEVPPPDDDSVTLVRREEMQRFKDETIAIEKRIQAMRAEKRKEIEDPVVRARKESADRADPPGFEELSLCFPPLDKYGRVSDPNQHISHQAVENTVKMAIKTLIEIQRDDNGMALDDEVEEQKIVDHIYEAGWGKKKRHIPPPSSVGR